MKHETGKIYKACGDGNSYKIVVGTLQGGKITLRRPRHRWKKSIKTYLSYAVTYLSFNKIISLRRVEPEPSGCRVKHGWN
jgi:hypothetical protein